MATLAGPIATSFDSLSTLTWLATAFLLGQASIQPLGGKITDIYSRRTGLIFSNIFLGLGNLLCGLSGRELTMILGRVLTGIGGGCLNLLSAVVVGDLIPLRHRGLWLGIGNLFWGVGNCLGGAFGGYVNDNFHWRVAFLTQVPLAIVSLLMTLSYPSHQKAKVSCSSNRSDSSTSRIDFLGSFLLVGMMISLLLGVTAGGNIVPWSHPLVFTTLPLAGALLCGFVYVEQKIAVEPILNLRILGGRNVLCSCLTLWLHNAITLTMLYYIPIYYQIKDLSTTQAGAALILFGPTFALGSLLAGTVILKTGRSRILLFIFLIGMLIAPLSLCVTNDISPLWLPLIALAILGLAISVVLTITWLAITSAVDPKDHAVATSTLYMFRSTGSVIGLSIASTIYQNVLERSLWHKLGHLINAEDLIHDVKNNLNKIASLPPEIQVIARSSYFLALRALFLSAAVAGTLALASGMLIQETRFQTSRNATSNIRKENLGPEHAECTQETE